MSTVYYWAWDVWEKQLLRPYSFCMFWQISLLAGLLILSLYFVPSFDSIISVTVIIRENTLESLVGFNCIQRIDWFHEWLFFSASPLRYFITWTPIWIQKAHTKPPETKFWIYSSRTVNRTSKIMFVLSEDLHFRNNNPHCGLDYIEL